MDLQSGSMVVLWQKHEGIPITARRVPERVSSPRSPPSDGRRGSSILNAERQRVIIGEIPAGALVLYMSSKNDSLTEALSGRKGPRNWTPAKIVFHLIMWGEKPVWVSSEDCELKSPEWKQ